jgi:hypothetical protein
MQRKNRPACTPLCSAGTDLSEHLNEALEQTCLYISMQRRNMPACTSLTAKEQTCLYISLKPRNKPVCTPLWSAGTDLSVHLDAGLAAELPAGEVGVVGRVYVVVRQGLIHVLQSQSAFGKLQIFFIF